MPKLCRVAAALPPAMMVLGAGIACGQAYPNKPVRLVTSNPGGTNDFVTRVVAQALAGSLGQQVLVDNRGGGSFVATEVAVRATPDGYTLLSIDSSGWLAPLITR